MRLVIVAAIERKTGWRRALVVHFFAEDFHGGIKQMGRRVVSRIVRSPLRITVLSQFYDVGYFICLPAHSDDGSIGQAQPDFVGLRNIERLLRHCRKPFGHMNDFARAQVNDDKTVGVLSTEKQALAFDVYRHVVHVTFSGQRNRLRQIQKARHGLHRQRLALRLRNECQH